MGIGGQQRSLTFVPETRSCVCVCVCPGAFVQIEKAYLRRMPKTMEECKVCMDALDAWNMILTQVQLQPKPIPPATTATTLPATSPPRPRGVGCVARSGRARVAAATPVPRRERTQAVHSHPAVVSRPLARAARHGIVPLPVAIEGRQLKVVRESDGTGHGPAARRWRAGGLPHAPKLSGQGGRLLATWLTF